MKTTNVILTEETNLNAELLPACWDIAMQFSDTKPDMVDFELFLGIPREAALKACQPCSKSAHYRAVPGDDDFISKERALQMLEHLQAEGEVKWEKENHGDKKDISHELCG